MRVLIVFSLVALSLAGCTDASDQPIEDGEAADPDSFVLEAGKGAIAGLVVDDRFRPIDLADENGAGTVNGFILLKETGEKTRSNANGEFTFVDVEPGRYTLRLSADGHESKDTTVTVEEGFFAEATLAARRIDSAGGFIISNEYAAFVPCGANVVFIGTSFDCTLDGSGDSQRESFIFDYSEYNATNLVMEMTAEKPDYYDIWLQPPGNEYCSGAYQIMGGPEESYLRFQLNLNESAVSSEGASGQGCETLPWLNDQPVQTIVYLNSLGFEQGVGFGAGVYYGLQTNFVQNAFVGDTGQDIDTFCVYCRA